MLKRKELKAMSYHMEFKFSLDLANKDIKEMMDRMQMPVPVLTKSAGKAHCVSCGSMSKRRLFQ